MEAARKRQNNPTNEHRAAFRAAFFWANSMADNIVDVKFGGDAGPAKKAIEDTRAAQVGVSGYVCQPEVAQSAGNGVSGRAGRSWRPCLPAAPCSKRP